MTEKRLNGREEQFDKLWEGHTPKGINRAKKLKFRQYILEHVRQKKRPLTYENAKRYWMGEIQKEEAESENY